MTIRNLRPLAALALLLGLACATPQTMAYKDSQQAMPKPANTVYLMTVTLENDYKPSYQPDLLVVNVEKKDAKSSADRLNFKMDEIGTLKSAVKEKGNSYLIRMELEPGDYVIQGLTGFYKSFFVNASCFAPIHSDLKVMGGGTVYLGHVDALIRERKENEFKAGPSIPLIDQAAAGFSGGTFDIKIADNMDADLKTFKEKFVQLKDVNVQKAILGPFDRAKAQQFWEAH